MRADHLAWLHHGGTAARWGNLGLWQDETPSSGDYANACAALARAVGQAAGMRAGDSVLSLACGGGEELALWAESFGAASVMGLEVEPSLAAQARHRAEAIHTGCVVEVFCADARRLPQLVGGRFDRIVCVDATYHLGPRLPLLRAAHTRLFAGGGLAFTDLVIDDDVRRGAVWRAVALRLGAGLAGITHADVLGVDQSLARLRDTGFEDVQVMGLDEAVLDGFSAFASRQAQRIGWPARASAAWRRVAITAALIRAGRGAGLGYALFSGRVPAAVTTAQSASTTPSVERTALSSSGIPG